MFMGYLPAVKEYGVDSSLSVNFITQIQPTSSAAWRVAV